MDVDIEIALRAAVAEPIPDEVARIAEERRRGVSGKRDEGQGMVRMRWVIDRSCGSEALIV